MDPLNTGDLLTIFEAASLMRSAPATIKHWIYRGKLARVKVGRHPLVRRGELESLVASMTTRRAPRSPQTKSSAAASSEVAA